MPLPAQRYRSIDSPPGAAGRQAPGPASARAHGRCKRQAAAARLYCALLRPLPAPAR